ncbi:MAG: bifunctional oligoribonuclease/PAP phosphatase NrnA [Deltaproteobacteria bacterium]|jgi:phosphoesterase RecJ-like protein|nr:bifunctional oligoribonuclease/PAP phosphatase NrnA [Deltaproteobacteria bacterium]
MSDLKTLKIREVISAIRNYERFMVLTHVHPDGDAMGALVAMQLIVRWLGKRVDAFTQDPCPPEYRFLPNVQQIRNKPPESIEYEAAILVDCGDLERVGEKFLDAVKATPFLINIDHHLVSNPFGNVNWVETTASSTCEMLFDLCMSLSLAPDKALSTALYTGILTDTGSFRYSNTNARVFEIISALVAFGADPARIASNVYDSATPEKLRLLARVLETMEFHASSRIVSAELSRSMLSDSPSTHIESEGFINHLRSVKSAEMAILFKETGDGLIHVSMRSRGDINVARLAQRHGGGGHKQAAACRIQGDLGTVRSMFIAEAVSYIDGDRRSQVV